MRNVIAWAIGPGPNGRYLEALKARNGSGVGFVTVDVFATRRLGGYRLRAFSAQRIFVLVPGALPQATTVRAVGAESITMRLDLPARVLG